MTYVLHYAPDNASLIVRLALDTAGTSFTTRLVDRAAWAQRSPAYLALNPHGLIPTLETDHGALFETGAILVWLSERHRGLGPAPGAPDRGDFLKWMFHVSNTLHPALGMLFYPSRTVGDAATDQNTLRKHVSAKIAETFATLDGIAAQGHPWFGMGTGALDFYVAACLRWCALYPQESDRGWFTLADYPHLAQMCATVERQPATARLIRAEGMNNTPFTAPAIPTPPEGSAT